MRQKVEGAYTLVGNAGQTDTAEGTFQTIHDPDRLRASPGSSGANALS